MIDNQRKIHIVIPAYNEEKKIGEVLDSLLLAGFSNILVVNDGSSDNTPEIVRSKGVDVLNMIMNRGQGAALRCGIEYLKQNHSPEVIVTFDADGQHKVEDILTLAEPVLKQEADIALGSRFLGKKSKIPPFRKTILKLGVFFTRFVSNIKLTDTHNGFRALGKKAISSIKINQRGMEHASEIIDEIKKNNLRYLEVPVEIIYSEYSSLKGQKTSNFIKIGLKTILKKIS